MKDFSLIRLPTLPGDFCPCFFPAELHIAYTILWGTLTVESMKRTEHKWNLTSKGHYIPKSQVPQQGPLQSIVVPLEVPGNILPSRLQHVPS